MKATKVIGLVLMAPAIIYGLICVLVKYISAWITNTEEMTAIHILGAALTGMILFFYF